MFSHKNSQITIFGHKHKIKNFIKNLIFIKKKKSLTLDFGSYLESIEAKSRKKTIDKFGKNGCCDQKMLLLKDSKGYIILFLF